MNSHHDNQPMDDMQIDELARSLPRFEPSPERVQATRAALLDAAEIATLEVQRRRTWRGLAVAGVPILAAAAVLLWLVLDGGSSRDAGGGGQDSAGRELAAGAESPAPAPAGTAEPVGTNPLVAAAGRTNRAQIQGSSEALYDLLGSAGHEVVVVREGTLAFDVPPPTQDEYFRVIVGGSSIEVRGARFHITAKNSELLSVWIADGGAVVYRDGYKPVELGPGDRWSPAQSAQPSGASEPAPSIKPALPSVPRGKQLMTERRPSSSNPEPAELPPVPPSSDHSAPARLPVPGESDFQAGWSELKRGNSERAAILLRRSCADSQATALGEDACYWYGVALQRSSQRAEAVKALRSFMQRWPRSSRAGEAAVLLGWLLYESRDFDGAEAYFRQATRDPLPAVRSSADKGLEAVSAARAAR